MKEKNLIKIPKRIREIFNNEYLNIDELIKLDFNNDKELLDFFNSLIPFIKKYLEENFPILKVLRVI